MSVQLTYELLIARIEDWARTTADVRLLLIVGSRARTIQPHDQWSDLDVVAAVGDPASYIEDALWIERFGHPLLTVIESTAVGGHLERRVLFEQGLDVDFSIVPTDAFRTTWTPEVAAVFQRGVRILVDKDNLAKGLVSEPQPVQPPPLPSRRDVIELVNAFYYQYMWTAKKLCRGELWSAKMSCDGGMKWQLLRMIEWHAAAIGQGGRDTWHSGRFLDRWAEKGVVQDVRESFATYDSTSLWRALFQTANLFKRLAVETARALGIALPDSNIHEVESLIRTYYDQNISPT